MPFQLKSDYQPCGDQPQAIDALVRGLDDGSRDQVLLGITGSGKTFTVASVINQTQRPTLVIAHNKTLAAQLYQEFKTLFPENSVEYFVSYYDYYQPEAYVPASDTYIEKDAIVNEEIDRLPEKYRLPIILCELEGKTHRQAAERLGWPAGTVGPLERRRAVQKSLRHRFTAPGAHPGTPRSELRETREGGIPGPRRVPGPTRRSRFRTRLP